VKHVLGPLADFPPGSVRVVSIGERSIGIINSGDDVYAVLNVCPHELAPVCLGTVSGTLLPSKPGEMDYGLSGRILRCPWHGYEFDLGDDGRAAFTTFRGKLRMFPAWVEDEQVVVEVKRGRRRAPTEATTRPAASRDP
jgi:3-phenylpropionate/trans-cinnamate dioxygenase ferredoxin subunit